MIAGRGLAQAFRAMGRSITILVVPTILLYLVFVGLQLISGEQGFLGLFFNMIVLLVLGAALVIAWRNEAMGGGLAMGSLLVFVIAGLVEGGFRETLGSSPLVWPVSLVAAIVKPQSFDPIPTWIIVTSWTITVAPVALFLGSWLLRREPK